MTSFFITFFYFFIFLFAQAVFLQAIIKEMLHILRPFCCKIRPLYQTPHYLFRRDEKRYRDIGIKSPIYEKEFQINSPFAFIYEWNKIWDLRWHTHRQDPNKPQVPVWGSLVQQHAVTTEAPCLLNHIDRQTDRHNSQQYATGHNMGRVTSAHHTLTHSMRVLSLS